MSSAGELRLCDEHQLWEAGRRRARRVRHLLGSAIMLVVTSVGGLFVQLTDDLSLRMLLIFVLMAASGLAFALLWFNWLETRD